MSDLPDLTDDVQGMCPMCSEYPWGSDECMVCGAWSHDHPDDHPFVPGDNRPHPHDFRFPAAERFARPYPERNPDVTADPEVP